MVSLPSYSPTSIANRALRHVPDRPIADIEENSLQARECREAYPDCVQELLEEHPWEFAYERSTLAATTNNRDGEWAYAYAIPQDCAYLGAILLPQNVSPTFGNGVVAVVAQPINYLGRPSTPMAYGGLDDYSSRNPGWRFALQGATIYTDAPAGAVAEYTRNSMAEASFSGQFVRALSLMMAARIAPALTKDAARKTALLGEFEVERQRAKANDRNRQVERYGDFVPDWLAVRA